MNAVTAGGGSISVCDWVALVMNLLDSQAGMPVCVLWQNMLLSQFLPPLKMWNGSFWELKKKDWRQASNPVGAYLHVAMETGISFAVGLFAGVQT